MKPNSSLLCPCIARCVLFFEVIRDLRIHMIHCYQTEQARITSGTYWYAKINTLHIYYTFYFHMLLLSVIIHDRFMILLLFWFFFLLLLFSSTINCTFLYVFPFCALSIYIYIVTKSISVFKQKSSRLVFLFQKSKAPELCVTNSFCFYKQALAIFFLL